MGQEGHVGSGRGGIGGRPGPEGVGDSTGGTDALASASRSRGFTEIGVFAVACEAAEFAVGVEDAGGSTAGVASNCWIRADEGAWSAGVPAFTGDPLSRAATDDGSTAAACDDTEPISAKLSREPLPIHVRKKTRRAALIIITHN